MQISSNISSLIAQANLSRTNDSIGVNLERLSSGLRINKSADDAAGLAISEKMRGQVKGLAVAQRNAQDGISLLQTAEGALNETHSILQRMRELAVQASNDTLQDSDRTAIDTEMSQLVLEIDRIASNTEFNGRNLLDGTYGSKLDTGTSTLAVGANEVTSIKLTGATASETFTLAQTANEVTLTDSVGNVQVITGLANTYSGTLNFDKLGVQITVSGADMSGAASWGGSTLTVITTATAAAKIQIGANAGQTLDVSISSNTSSTLGVDALAVDSNTNANLAITAIDAALDDVSGQRSDIGAYQNRLEHTINYLSNATTNLQSAESRIRDVDMAKEMSDFTKNQILNQAGTAMLAQANQRTQSILSLFR